MAFEQFTHKDEIIRRFQGQFVPLVSIFRNRVLSFNKVATQMYFQDGYEWIDIFYDKDTMMVGIVLRQDEGENSYKLRRNYTKHHLGVHLKGFFNAIDLIPKRVLHYKLERDGNGMLFFDRNKLLKEIKDAVV